MERNVGGVGVPGHHIRESKAGVVIMHVPTAWKTFCSCEATFEMIGRLERDLADSFLGMTSFSRGLEGFRNHVEIVTSGFGVLDGLLWCCMSVCLASVRSRTAPGTLTSCEDTIDHIDPIEEGINDEHDGVQPNLESP